MRINLTDAETAALLALINRAIAIGGLSLSSQTRTLQGVRQKILAAPSAAPTPARRGDYSWPH